ncbi:MAG: phosphoglycolate phosphatase [Pseudomonadota bacterium]|nr:phosphoglycolate phosphatase [Pseudomonadota bacterium]
MRHLSSVLPAQHTGIADVRAILFDLDGTLVDSLQDLTCAANHMCSALGHRKVSQDQVRRWIGHGALRLVERALTATIGRAPSEVEVTDGYTLFKDYYLRAICDHTTTYPGVRSMVKQLGAWGLHLGIVTNKPRRFAEALLECLRLSQIFNVLVAGDDLATMKPDPAMLIHACRSLGIETSQAVYIGDSSADVRAAQAAQMPVLVAAWGYDQAPTPRDLKVDWVMEAASDMTRWLSQRLGHDPR